MGVMAGSRALALSSHPAPTVAVTAVAGLLAVAVDATPGTVAYVVGGVLTGQLSIGWGNDWLDRERDRRSGRPDKPVAAGQIGPDAVRAAALLAALACVPLSLAVGTPGLLHLAAVASGWAYNLALKSTVGSVLPFAVSFGLLPAYVVTAAGRGAPGWLVAAGALLGSGAHFANVLPDLADDAATGVRGLGHRLGRLGCAVTAGLLLTAAVLVLAVGPPGPVGVVGRIVLALAGVVALGGVVAGRRPGSRAPFLAVLVLAVLAVTLFLISGTDLGRDTGLPLG